MATYKQWKRKDYKPKKKSARTGMGEVQRQYLTSLQMSQLQRKGSITVTLPGNQKKKLTDCNVQNGYYEYYQRSDLSKPGNPYYSARDYCKDESTKASRQINREKGAMTGD